MAVPQNYPSFSQLPVDKDGPRLNAWGLWGSKDQLGTLNLLTDDIVARAAAENIKTGARVSLNWSMTGASNPRFVRKLLEQNMINKAPLKHAHDDEWHFNSQCSSQWDGFRHYAYQDEAAYYMGRTAEEFAASPVPNGIQHVSGRGISGRAVFVDWYAWHTATKPDIPIDAMSNHAVPFSEIKQALAYQGLSLSSFRQGDILVVRFGYLLQYETMPDAKRSILDERYRTEKPENIGLEPSRELLEFLWDSKIAAICGDTRSLEVWPCKELQWHMHEILLAGWGMPIGELFDLEELARVCALQKRSTFFMASSPMNVPGGVASPPNALAFF
ncbi:hypothetical protein Micbo1qcDRAFT_186026 [Microdochium bolleyi]|uniref:Cyclase-domain-containing protein n=1 Tax=Microdochium bolleyi TaxID=196109 RepID=A0A136INR9_9PEZI|nr:hypothetical protein Micbo1qcDRAFT_186026 [Microdochium bolleyi]